MNKKLLVFGIGGILALTLVSAIAYYAIFSSTFNVLPSIVLDGETEQELGEVFSGDIIEGEEIVITNNAPTQRDLTISEDSDEDMEVTYISYLTLSQKVVDFESDVWELLEEGNTASVRYVVIGDEFNAEVVDGELEGYVLVYYKDNSDRFSSPAQAISIDSISGNLAYENDANNDEYDYCETGEYTTCQGAKIWYVPTTAVDSEGNVDWSQAGSFLFETELIQYNIDGQITIYPESSLTITPVYEIGSGASGEYTITTTIA